MSLQIDLTFADFTQLLTTGLLRVGFAPLLNARACLFSLAWNQAATTRHLPAALHEHRAPLEICGAASTSVRNCLAFIAAFSWACSEFPETNMLRNNLLQTVKKRQHSGVLPIRMIAL